MENYMCRVCLSSEQQMKCINAEDHKICNFSEFFTLLTSVLVDRSSKVTNMICEECINQVLDAHKLRQMALKSDSYLRFNVDNNNKPNYPVSEKTAHDKTLNSEDELTNCKHSCTVCSKTFAYKSEMERHKMTHNPVFKCSSCNKSFGFKSSLIRHEKQHRRSDPLPCSLCTSLFKDQDLLERHMQYSHSDKRHTCAECGSRFGSAAALRSHVRSHDARRMACRRGCDKTFALSHHRTRHEATHTGIKKYFCSDCGKGFVQAHHLQSHTATTHRPEAQLPCPLLSCSKTFPTRYALNRHMHLHEKKNIQCATCKKSFKSNLKLKKHLRRCVQVGAEKSQVSSTETQASLKTEKSTCPFCMKQWTSKYLEKHQTLCQARHTFSIEKTNIDNVIDCKATKLAKDVNENSLISRNTIYKRDQTQNCLNNVDTPVSENRHETQQIVEDIANMMDDQAKTSHVTEIAKCLLPNKTTNIEDVESYCGSCCCKNIGESEPCNSSMVDEKISNSSKIDVNIRNDVESVVNIPSTKARRVEMQANDCKVLLGKCIVGNGGEGAEECICAKVSYEELPLPEYLTTPLLVALEQQGYYPS